MDFLKVEITTDDVQRLERIKELLIEIKTLRDEIFGKRKTYGSILLDNHIDNRFIIGQVGHTDILCTENHYHRNRRDMEKKMEIISQIPEFMTK